MHNTQLKNFLTIIECGSINKAAQKLFMSQSTLSQQVKQLEEEVGYELFDRKGKRLELTAEGGILADYAAKAVVEHEKVLQKIHEFRYGIKHTLTIGLAQSSLTVDEGRWISETVSLHPEINFYSVVYQFNALLALMDKGEVDICLTKQIIRDADFLNDYEYKLIKTNNVIVVAADNFDFGNKAVISLKDLDGMNVILRTKHEERFLAKCAKYDSYPIVRCTTRSNALKFELVKNRVGVGFFVDSFADLQEITAANLRFYRIDDINMKSNTYVVYPKAKKNSPAVKAFLEVVYKDIEVW